MATREGEALVEVREVWKAFDAKPVLRGLSLTLGKGTTLAVMGGSGSGKTVLLRICDGLLAPDDGEVYLFGTRIDTLMTPPFGISCARAGGAKGSPVILPAHI